VTNRPSVPEIITVNSEELQTLIRDLLPSQNGFGSELQATNVITPIIDLTATAEGSTLRTDLQTALAFGSNTTFQAAGSTVSIANSPGFYRIKGIVSIASTSGANQGQIRVTDGSTTKALFDYQSLAGGNGDTNQIPFDFILWLNTGESCDASSSSGSCFIIGSSRQIADPQGNFIQPSGFPV
jgi:hypothetical protein